MVLWVLHTGFFLFYGVLPMESLLWSSLWFLWGLPDVSSQWVLSMVLSMVSMGSSQPGPPSASSLWSSLWFLWGPPNRVLPVHPLYGPLYGFYGVLSIGSSRCVLPIGSFHAPLYGFYGVLPTRSSLWSSLSMVLPGVLLMGSFYRSLWFS